MGPRRLPMKRLAIGALICALGVAPCAGQKNRKDEPNQIGDRDIGKCLNFYSQEREIAMGKQLAEEVARQTKTADDPIVNEFVNRVGQNLVRNSDAKVP